MYVLHLTEDQQRIKALREKQGDLDCKLNEAELKLRDIQKQLNEVAAALGLGNPNGRRQ